MHSDTSSETVAIVEGFGDFSKAGSLDKGHSLAILKRNDNHFRISLGSKQYNAIVRSFDAQQKTAVINIDGSDYTVRIQEPIDRLINALGFLQAARHSLKEIRSPMPGLVVEVFVKEGQEVFEGEKLFTLEAMKMENIIKSPGQGVVSEIYIQKGAAVDKNQVLILFE